MRTFLLVCAVAAIHIHADVADLLGMVDDVGLQLLDLLLGSQDALLVLGVLLADGRKVTAVGIAVRLHPERCRKCQVRVEHQVVGMVADQFKSTMVGIKETRLTADVAVQGIDSVLHKGRPLQEFC